MANNSEQTVPKTQYLTPLWVISGFLGISEVALCTGVLFTANGIQIALTVFFIAFPISVAIAFFAILWKRPYVFYPPHEYGGTTNVKEFVDAMQSTPSTDDNLYENIEDAVRSTVTSKKIIDELTEVVSEKAGEHIEKKVADILDSAADDTVETIREKGFLAIDTHPLLGDDGKVIRTLYNPSEPIYKLIQMVSIFGRIRPKYGLSGYEKDWVLRDKATGTIFDNLVVSREDGITFHGLSLEDAGLYPGIELEVIPTLSERAEKPTA